jgi:hypothetical protein
MLAFMRKTSLPWNTSIKAYESDVGHFVAHLALARELGNFATEALLIAHALKGAPEVCAWGQAQQVAKAMLDFDGIILKICVKNVFAKGGLQRLGILLDIPVVAELILECAVISMRHLKEIDWVARSKKRPFTRADCLARGGAVMRAARKRHVQRWLVKKYALTPSDFASVGLGWPGKLNAKHYNPEIGRC